MICKKDMLALLYLLFTLFNSTDLFAASENKTLYAHPQNATTEDVRNRLSSPFHEKLLQRTYESIINRAEPDGYFQESLIGTYQGMFCRTSGVLVRLFLKTGELERAEKTIDYCITAMLDNDMERIPHVIGHREALQTPVPNADTPACMDTAVRFTRINGGCGAAQTFVAGPKPLHAVEVFGHKWVPDTHLHVEIKKQNGTPVTTVHLPITKDIILRWFRIELPEPIKLKSSQTYRIEFNCPEEKGQPILFAGHKPPGKTFITAYQLQSSGQIAHPDKTLSMVLDYGGLAHHEDKEKIILICGADQIDGQAHVLMVWAMLARQRGHTGFEDRTYHVIAKLMDRSTTAPYLSFEPIRAHKGLVCNIHLEHSRDGQMWHAYDFLTQSFVVSALENMIPIARRRGDERHVKLWSDRLAFLNKNIAQNMTRQFQGKPIYYEMLLPTGREPVPFPGISWLNLAPIPSGWKSIDNAIFRNTIDTWHRVAQIDWDGPRITSSDWLPEGHTDVFGKQQSDQIIGKALGWDMVYCFRTGDYDRLCEMLDFIEQVNSTEIYAEAFSYKGNNKWVLHNPGNGEQAAWWSWSMAVIRQAVGLPVLPVK